MKSFRFAVLRSTDLNRWISPVTLFEINLFRDTFAFVQTRVTLLLLLVVHSTRRIYKPDYDLSKNSFRNPWNLQSCPQRSYVKIFPRNYLIRQAVKNIITWMKLGRLISSVIIALLRNATKQLRYSSIHITVFRAVSFFSKINYTMLKFARIKADSVSRL